MAVILRGWIWKLCLSSHTRQLSGVAMIKPRVTILGSALCALCGLQRTPLLHHSAVLAKKRKGKDEKKTVFVNQKPMKKKSEVVSVWKNMTVSDLATALNRDIDTVFEIFLYVDNSDPYDHPDSPIDNLRVIQDAVKRAGLRFKIDNPQDNVQKEEKNKDADRRLPAKDEDLVRRPPVVTIMGHVDHGKTTLLDALRHSAIVDSEFGGITQHIGAFSVKLDSGERVTFLDTPGHAAFAAMRARGALVTDLVVLVVAADDGVMEQTKESIKYAQEAQVPIVVAINKIDKPETNISETRRMLLDAGLQLEEEGGEVQAVGVSALQGTNLGQLVEAVILQAEVLNLRADPRGLVEASVVEAKLDPGRGKIATCVVERGTLRRGAVVVAGTAWGKVRNMFDDAGKPIQAAPPATPVQIIGWRQLPSAGDLLLEVESERRALEVVAWRESQELEAKMVQDQVAIKEKLEEHLQVYRAQREEKRRLGIRYKMRRKGPRQKENPEETSGPRVSVVLKGDVDGSVEAILNVLDTYHDSECHLDLVSYGVGEVTPSDVTLAQAFKGIIYTFNTRIPEDVQRLAAKSNVIIKEHNVIYHLVDDLKEELSNQLPQKDVEEVLGEANVLEEFIITEGKKKSPVAGCRCVKGLLKRDALYRLVRNQEVLFEGKLSSMRHLKLEVESIARGRDCGLKLEDEEVRFQAGDTLLCYHIHKVKQVTEWDPGF